MTMQKLEQRLRAAMAAPVKDRKKIEELAILLHEKRQQRQQLLTKGAIK